MNMDEQVKNAIAKLAYEILQWHVTYAGDERAEVIVTPDEWERWVSMALLIGENLEKCKI